MTSINSVSDIVKIDKNHAMLLTGLIVSQKPSSILEIGLGGGESADAIISGLNYNNKNFTYTLVDNWYDWGFKIPEDINIKYGKIMNIISMSEKDFIFSCNNKYDFIMSDGDHHNTDQWFDYVYDNLLNENGILIYHDVNLIENEFINLRNIYNRSKERGLKFRLFNQNSLNNERCQRGLMVIFK